ncbi:hypothetical protein [Streptomyces sp. NPDC058268]|uniref:hypothetical protein n=1 Tax=Streptomyces sp. NPDC058268 TaxID=3346413 RepID=UPI0036E407C0
MPYDLKVTSEFFQPGRSYTNADGFTPHEHARFFDVEHVTRHPERGHLRAIGWMRTAAPGSRRRMEAIDEDQIQAGEWRPHSNPATLLGHPATDGRPAPVLLVCTYGWSCGCPAPALVVFTDAPTASIARSAADDAAWAHAHDIESDEQRPQAEPHGCGSPRPQLFSALRTAYFAAPRLEAVNGHDDSTVLRVHARTIDGEPA